LQLATKAVAQANINPTALQGMFRLPLPSKSEQTEIADRLSCWDDAIHSLKSFLASKIERRRGLMQQLLTGQTRFSEFKAERWSKMHLGDVVTYQPRTVVKPKGSFLAAGIRSHGKGVFLKRDFEAEDIALDELFVIRTDDLVVNITFGWEGAAAIVPPEADGALVSHRFPTFTFKPGVSFPGYFRHVIKQRRFVHEMGLASPGGAGRNRVLSKTEFLHIPIALPSLAEQEQIAAVLNNCDREIELLQKQLAALKEQKRGLMQKLLTGEIRVRA
jgi:type I restriction enzyme S subunit